MQKKSQADQHKENTINLSPEHILKELHSFEGKLAQEISDFSGSMNFVYLHGLWFIIWILINHGVFKPLIPAFDPFPYGLLTMVVSLEAIFLSTFILINQNRQALVDTYREYEEEKEQQEEEQEQEELEEEVEDIQKDLDQIKDAISILQQKLLTQKSTNGSSHKPPEST